MNHEHMNNARLQFYEPPFLAPMSSLRPHDVAVALQLVLTPATPYRALADAVGISQGEAHNAVRRLVFARLVRSDTRTVHRGALLEFLLGGVPYAFPAELGPETRGIPTAHAGPLLAAEFAAADPVVWPAEHGEYRGAMVEPLYTGATSTFRNNPELYELLTLVDAVRIGRARERHRAQSLLRERLAASICGPQ